jgi:hypothetical protein
LLEADLDLAAATTSATGVPSMNLVLALSCSAMPSFSITLAEMMPLPPCE